MSRFILKLCFQNFCVTPLAALQKSILQESNQKNDVNYSQSLNFFIIKITKSQATNVYCA